MKSGGQPGSKNAFKHGMSKTKFYMVWMGIVSRCKTKSDPDYKNYGARGIQVEWTSFEDFHRDMFSSYREGLCIDRTNNEGNYSRNNCKWVDRKTQNRNTRRNVSFNGELAVDACRRLGGSVGLISGRLQQGWSLERAFTTPISKFNK
jgi:hypothetical protein